MVTDQSGAVVVKAVVTITNDGTNIAQTAQSDEHGQYFLSGLRPSVYTIKAEMSGFRVSEKKNVVLQVDQQTSVDFVLHPLSISQTMEVTETQPLLDTESATLGTEITGEYIKDLPLMNRSFFGLTFLAAGVTEVSGAGTVGQLSVGNKFHVERAAQCDRRDTAGRGAAERAGTGRGRKFQRLLRAAGRGHAGNEGAEQQFLGRVRQ